MLTTNFMLFPILDHDRAWVTAHSDVKLICPDWRTAGQDTARWARRLYPTSTVGQPNTIVPPRTVRAPGGRMIPPTCGTNTVTMGQTCGSVTLAAGIPI